MIVVVTGGRSYGKDDGEHCSEQRHVWSVLDALNAVPDEPIDWLYCGGAPGADSCAFRWAEAHKVPVTVVMAEWLKHGKAAGPKRNRAMLEQAMERAEAAEGYAMPVRLVAFPGGRGTANCVATAELLGIPVTMED